MAIRSLFAAWTIVALVACSQTPDPKATKAASAPGGTGAQASSAPPAPEVSVITVQAAALPVELEFAGQTIGSRETEVRARVNGILQKRLYEEGSTVKAGAPLFQIDPATFQNQVASADAAVGVANARVQQSD
jgi:membrane fusion protein, multidrug efflux system